MSFVVFQSTAHGLRQKKGWFVAIISKVEDK